MTDVTRILNAIEAGEPHAADGYSTTKRTSASWRPKGWSTAGQTRKRRPWFMRLIFAWPTANRTSTGTVAAIFCRSGGHAAPDRQGPPQEYPERLRPGPARACRYRRSDDEPGIDLLLLDEACRSSKTR